MSLPFPLSSLKCADFRSGEMVVVDSLLHMWLRGPMLKGHVVLSFGLILAEISSSIIVERALCMATLMLWL